MNAVQLLFSQVDDPCVKRLKANEIVENDAEREEDMRTLKELWGGARHVPHSAGRVEVQ